MFKKKILGIYVDRYSLHYAAAASLFSSYTLKSPGPGFSPYDSQQGNGVNLLKTFLTSLEPDKSREIYVAIPRSEFFVREIILPSMPVEDALLSIKNSLALYSHLDPDSIYYDVIVSDRNGDSFNSLLVYAAKDEMEKYRKLFAETGHLNSLKALFPLSYGAATLFGNKKNDQMSFFSLIQEDNIELFAASGETLIFSVSCSFDAQDEKEIILNSLQSRFPNFVNNNDSIINLSRSNISSNMHDMMDFTQNLETIKNDYKIQEDNRPFINQNITKSINKKKFSGFPNFQENYASAALAPAISKIQQISLDDQPVKIKIIHPFRYILPLLCILIVILYLVTDELNAKNIQAQSELQEINIQLKELESGLEPLQNKIDTLKKAARFKTDVEEFMLTRPDLYTVINEIASLVPDGTWFANFTFNNNGITLRGTGTDALKTVETLRSSRFFDNVMLRGSVNRRPNGDESFTVVISLKSKKELGGKLEGIDNYTIQSEDNSQTKIEKDSQTKIEKDSQIKIEKDSQIKIEKDSQIKIEKMSGSAENFEKEQQADE